MSTHIEQLKTAIRNVHNCEAVHRETVPVKEVFRGQVAWDGEVEVFDLRNHPRARRCYAWMDGDRDAITVLEIPPVTSPQTAVRALIASRARG